MLLLFNLVDVPSSSNQSGSLLSSTITGTPSSNASAVHIPLQAPAFLTVSLAGSRHHHHQRASVPRPFFFRDVVQLRSGSGGGIEAITAIAAAASTASSAGTVAGIAAPRIRRLPFTAGGQQGVRGMTADVASAALNNPVLLAKYAVPTASVGRQPTSAVTARQVLLLSSSASTWFSVP